MSHLWTQSLVYLFNSISVVIWCGDFNYRLNIDLELKNSNNYSAEFKDDQV